MINQLSTVAERKTKVRTEKKQGCTKENKADAKARARASVLFSSILDHTKFNKGGTETIVRPSFGADACNPAPKQMTAVCPGYVKTRERS
jgi:hypothetical protein